MSSTSHAEPITLSLTADPCFARLVRMTAANVAALSSMSVDRVEDVRMAAEEAFIYACSVDDGGMVNIAFVVDEQHVAMDFSLECDAFAEPEAENPAAYAGLILAAVCDVYEKSDTSAHLHLELKADI